MNKISFLGKMGFFISVVFFVLYSTKSTNIYHYVIALIAVVLFIRKQISGQKEQEREQMLLELERYLSCLRHSYELYGNIEETMWNSIEGTGKIMEQELSEIYQVITGDKSREEYQKNAKDRYFVTFLALCELSAIYGDWIVNGHSVFLSNLSYLKNEIHLELLKRKKIRFLFSGLIFLAIFPAFCLGFIEKWGISNLPELERYYQGPYGIISTILIYLVTICSYEIICFLKSNLWIKPKIYWRLEKLSRTKWITKWIVFWCRIHTKGAEKIHNNLRNIGNGMNLRQYITRELLLFISAFFLLQAVQINLIIAAKNSVLQYAGELKNIDYEHYQDLNFYKKLVNEQLLKLRYNKVFYIYNLFGFPVSLIKEEDRIKIIYADLKNKNPKLSSNELDILSKTISEKLEEYSTIHYHVWYLFFSMLLSILICKIPFFILKLRLEVQKSEAVEEVMQYHSILMMLMHFPGSNVEIMLRWLERYSQIYKEPLLECLEEYSYDENNALTSLKQKENLATLAQIVDCFYACDSVGVSKAFEVIEGETDYILDKMKQENEILAEKKGAVGKGAAYMPIFLVLIFYLIVPFIIESLSRLSGYMIELNGG